MCKKCQKFGHVHAQCPNPKFYCGLCANEHPTWECPFKQGQDLVPKCANCKGEHKAASTSFPVRKVALERAQQELARVLNSDAIHQVPRHYSSKGKEKVESSSSSEFSLTYK